jgi:hypothetical protein
MWKKFGLELHSCIQVIFDYFLIIMINSLSLYISNHLLICCRDERHNTICWAHVMLSIISVALELGEHEYSFYTDIRSHLGDSTLGYNSLLVVYRTIFPFFIICTILSLNFFLNIITLYMKLVWTTSTLSLIHHTKIQMNTDYWYNWNV